LNLGLAFAIRKFPINTRFVFSKLCKIPVSFTTKQITIGNIRIKEKIDSLSVIIQGNVVLDLLVYLKILLGNLFFDRTGDILVLTLNKVKCILSF